MLKEILLEFFERDLHRVKEEIFEYAEEATIWKIHPGIHNSAGNLCLHLVGNLHHFIGAVLGNTGYIRERAAEFAPQNVSREILFRSLDETVIMINKTLHDFTDADFDKIYPVEKHGRTVTTRYMLLHLLTHLNYHLGQINYHRRLISGIAPY